MSNKNTDIGRTVVSGAYGQGQVTAETEHSLTLRLPAGEIVEVNKAGNLHYVPTKLVVQIKVVPNDAQHFEVLSDDEETKYWQIGQVELWINWSSNSIHYEGKVRIGNESRTLMAKPYFAGALAPSKKFKDAWEAACAVAAEWNRIEASAGERA